MGRRRPTRRRPIFKPARFRYFRNGVDNAPQIVGETDQIKAYGSEKDTESIPFWTIGDRVINSWQSIKDSVWDQVSADLRAMGAMFSLTEDTFVMNALYTATSGANATTYNNAQTIIPIDGYMPFQELLLWKARMGAPTADSHPDVPEIVRRSLLNLYNANVCIVPPSVYEGLLANRADPALMDQTFWRNSQILDNGAIQTMGGMTIYRMNCGHWQDGTPLSDWVESNDVYLIDTRLGGVDMVQKEPLQTINWDTYERRINNLMIYERLNAVVRNARSVLRLHVADEYSE